MKLRTVANPVLAKDIRIEAGGRTFRLKTRSIRLKHDARRSAVRAYKAGAAVTAISPGAASVPVSTSLAVTYRADSLNAFLQDVDRRLHVRTAASG